MSASLADTIGELVEGRSIGADGAAAALAELLSGASPPEQVAGFLVALAAKGPTTAELVGLLDTMTALGVPLELPADLHRRAVDVVGTGGDRLASVNVSTMAALVVAGSGVPVVKHGSRKASSTVGSADLLEALGVTIAPGPERVVRCVAEAGFGFCFAPAFHPALAAVAPVRQALGIRTVFNFLGPMANPARVRYLLLGVSDPVLHDVMAVVVGERGVRHALVVRGEDGLDEVSVSGRTRVLDVSSDAAGDVKVSEQWLDPANHGVPVAPLEAIQGGDAQRNAAAVHEVLGGATGPLRDVVVLNAAVALVAAEQSDAVDEGLALAAESVDSGAAARVLARVVELSAPR
ncbi:MAG TPA: anthranilate phosphoribosyltransferase [Acidimicrobiales bacterium]|nr:anthranilate phosphoribosyltransferase [Acidimicrobiales bacterium]